MKPFTLAFVDSEAEGHHVSPYARTILGEAVRRGWQCIWLTSPEAVQHPAARQMISELGDRLKIEAGPFPNLALVPGTAGGATVYEIQHYFSLRRLLKKVVRKYQIDVVYLAWMDHCSRMLGLFGPPVRGLNYAGMHMHVTLHEQINRKVIGARAPAIHNAIIRRMYACREIREVMVIIEPFAEYARSANLLGKEKISYVPDIANFQPGGSRTEARAALGLSENDILLLSYGTLTVRKGVQAMLRAALRAAEPGRLVLLAAGRQEAQVSDHISQERAALLKRGIRLVEWNCFMDEEAEKMAFPAADIVWMGYDNFTGSSAVLLQAMAAGLPVIACRAGVIGETVRKHELGLIVEPSDAAAAGHALNQLMADPGWRTQCGRRGAKIAGQHLPERVGATVCDLIYRASLPDSK